MAEHFDVEGKVVAAVEVAVVAAAVVVVGVVAVELAQVCLDFHSNWEK